MWEKTEKDLCMQYEVKFNAKGCGFLVGTYIKEEKVKCACAATKNHMITLSPYKDLINTGNILSRFFQLIANGILVSPHILYFCLYKQWKLKQS